MVAATTVLDMSSKANEQVLASLRQVVSAALKDWLDEHKADVLQALRDAVPAPQISPSTAKAAEENRQPQFLNTAEVAARWRLHPETVRRMLRHGRLPRMFIGRRRLVPLSAITDCEEKGAVPSRG